MPRRPAGFTMIEMVVVVAIISVLISLLLPAVQAAREAARRTQCSNNLLQLGIAIENYESTHQVLPPGVVDSTGPVVESPSRYQFGWIARILPYLEQKNAYNRLDFGSGVYTPNNMTARAQPMYVLLCPSDRWQGSSRTMAVNFGPSPTSPATLVFVDPATTAYAACHNDVEGPIDVGNTGVFFLNGHVRSRDIEDGLAHTIYLGEKKAGGTDLGWASGTRATLRNTGTKINQTTLDPSDLANFEAELAHRKWASTPGPDEFPASPPPTAPPSGPGTPIPVGGFGSSHAGGSNFLMGDGSARFLKTTIDGRVYRLLGNRADGEPIGDDQY